MILLALKSSIIFCSFEVRSGVLTWVSQFEFGFCIVLRDLIPNCLLLHLEAGRNLETFFASTFGYKPSSSTDLNCLLSTRHLNLSSISLRPESPLNERRISDILKFGWAVTQSSLKQGCAPKIFQNPSESISTHMNPSESIPAKRLATALSAFPPRTTCLSPHHSHRLTSEQTSVWGGGEDQNSHFFLVFTSKYLYKQADSSSAATWQYRRAFEPTSTWGDLLSQAKVVLCCLTDNSINNLIVILCRPQMSILCNL